VAQSGGSFKGPQRPTGEEGGCGYAALIDHFKRRTGCPTGPIAVNLYEVSRRKLIEPTKAVRLQGFFSWESSFSFLINREKLFSLLVYFLLNKVSQ
jgi:hypothetical protein